MIVQRGVFEAKYMEQLNPQQRQAVETVDGAVLLLAVPGSGKTTVLVTRLGYMVCVRGIDPRNILTMTYTVSATREMKARFAAQFGEEYARNMEFRTINGVSARIIAYYSRYVSRRPAFTLLEDEGEIKRLLRQIYQSMHDDYPEDSLIKDLRTSITYIKNMMLTDEEIQELDTGVEELPAIYRAYCAELKRRGMMDYDDQMSYALTILKGYPAILDAFQEQFPYLCVDEAQDTSKIQHAIIQLLAGKQGNLFMVGDEDQSIYGFRAAYPDALLHFEETYPGAQVLLMEENYRSTPAIVTAANHFVAHNRFRRPKTMQATQGEGPQIQRISAVNRTAQFQYLFGMGEQCRTDTAILYRNNDSALPLIDWFQRQGIPYNCRKFDEGFFTNRVIGDVTDIIYFACNPCDEQRFMRIYYKLGCHITKKAAAWACQKSLDSQRPILVELLDSADTKGYVRDNVASAMAALRQIPQDTALDAVHRIWNELQYGQYVQSNHLDAGKQSVLELLARNESSATGLLRRLQELREITAAHTNRRENHLTLSTIHSSKGLEYDRVYLLDVVDGLLPSITVEEARTEEEICTYEEERRLFYVAMTRARQELYFFTCGQPSAFTSEVIQTLPVAVRDEEDVFAPLWENLLGRHYTHRTMGRGKIAAQCGRELLVCYETGKTALLTMEEMLAQRAPETEYTQPGAGIKPAPRRPAPHISSQVRGVLDCVSEGTRIRHSLFGSGMVRKVEGDTVTIRFDNADGDKKFGLRLSVEKGYLTLL